MHKYFRELFWLNSRKLQQILAIRLFIIWNDLNVWINRVQKCLKKSCKHIFFCLLPQRACECVCTFRREFVRASGQLGDLRQTDRRLQLSDSYSASDRLAVCSLPALIWPERLHSYSNPPAPAAEVTGHCPSNVSDECTSLDYLTLVLGTLAFTALDFCRVPLAKAASTRL